MAIITDQDFLNAKRDIDDIGKSVNTEAVINPRWGDSFKSLPLVSKDWSQKLIAFNDNAQQILADGQARFDSRIQALDSKIQELDDAIDQISLDGLPAIAVTTATGSNQQFINDLGGVDYYPDRVRAYPLNGEVRLDNGDVVRSIEPNNTNNPNTNMSGWVNPKLDQENFNNQIKPKVNFYSITPEMFGAKGDEVTDDSNAFQSAVTFADTMKAKIVLEGKYRLTKTVSAYTFYGFTSASCGAVIVDHADDVFKFAGAGANTWLERIDFEYKQATTIGKSTFLFEFPYLVSGLKIDRLNLNGFEDCNWTFLKLKGSGGAGFFGGFLFSNVRSYHMYADVHYDTTPWANSSTFFNNFKFYGDYGLLIGDNGILTDANITGWWGQEVRGGVIHCQNGVMDKCEIVCVLNWDTNTVAINLGKNTKSNSIKKTYVFDIVDDGYCNDINTDDNLYVSNSVTAVASSLFKFNTVASKGSTLGLFTQTLSGNAKAASGITGLQGGGLNIPAYWLQTKPATTEPATSAGSAILDSIGDQLAGINMVGFFDRYAKVTAFYDFYLNSADLDDQAFLIGVGSSASTSTPISGSFITVIGGRIKIVSIAWDGGITVNADIGVVTQGRYQVQFTLAAYQSGGFSGAFVNGQYKSEVTIDSSVHRRPVVKVKSTTKETLVGLISSKFTVLQAAQMK